MVSVSTTKIDDDQTWMDTAPKVKNFAVGIDFVLYDSFPTTTKGHPRDWPTKPLRLPAFPRRKALVASFREVEGHEAELATYYHEARETILAHGGSLDTLYWLRLTLSGGQPGTDIGFSWWDTLSEMRPIFRWMETAAEGEIFDDLDQGWRVQAVRRGDELFFRHSGFDQGGEYGKLRVSRETCIATARDAWNRTMRIVGAL